MNLHSIVAGYVSAINPMITASYQASIGDTIGANFKPVPNYAAAVSIQCQKQPMLYRDLVQIEGLNLNGEKAAFYVTGNWQGVERPAGKGGDLITLPDGSVWLVVQLLESWSETSGWCKVACTLQNNS